ncbi:MAG: hypothetical protein IKR52_03420, partial [Paludibacteraceae bacterium]|nr:hypothetical protein [Paludibacteraceae bacterium]
IRISELKDLLWKEINDPKNVHTTISHKPLEIRSNSTGEYDDEDDYDYDDNTPTDYDIEDDFIPQEEF